MKKLFLSFFVCVSFTLAAQVPDSVRVFVDSALSIMQHHAMNAPTLNWRRIKDSVNLLSSNAKSYAGTVPALQYAFNQLNDKHGWLVIDDKDYRNTKLLQTPRILNDNMKAAAAKGPRIYPRRIAGYAYVSIPFFNGQTVKDCNAFAQRLQDSLCSVVKPGTKGLIIDLRLNAGGNTQAMVTGIANVIGNQNPKRKGYAGDWEIQNYDLSLNDTFRIQLMRNCGDLSGLSLAVITGPVTASAGEFIALGLLARKNTVLVGERTAGYTSANAGYLLPGLNNGIVVAENYAKDIKGKQYPDGLSAQIEVIGGDDFFNPDNDKKMAAAIKWLNGKTR